MMMNIDLNFNRCRPMHLSRIPCIPRTLPLFPSRTNLKLAGEGGGRIICCRAAEQLLHDLPFSIAIGASLFNTLLFSPSSPAAAAAAAAADDDDPVSSTDARFAVMTLISFIPFFNWLSWVFALMDTGHRRYAVYALVYLAPYIRTNLSLSPEESWLPIVSIVLCIVHIQLEASIRSGDLESFNLFSEIGKRLGFIDLQKDRPPTSETKNHDEERRQDSMNLPLDQHHLRDEIRKWKVPRTPSEDVEHADEDGNLDDREKH